MNKVMSDKVAIFIFIAPALIVFSTICLLPILVSVYYSTLDWNGVAKGVFVGIQNYITIFTNPSDFFFKGIWNSLILAFLSVFVQVPLALLLAIVISKGIKGEGFFRSAYFIPVIISTTVIGQLWMKIYHPNNGLLNMLLEKVGLESWARPWLADPKFALGAAFFVLIWQYVGYHMLLLYSGVKAIPPTLYEAAQIDGANNTQIATKITIPLIMPMIKVCATFALIGSLKTFDLIYVLTKGGPIHATEVPTTLMFSSFFLQSRYGVGSAMAVFVLIECLVFTIMLQKMFKVEDLEY